MKWSASRHLAVPATERAVNHLNLELFTTKAPIFIPQIPFDSPLEPLGLKARSLAVGAAVGGTLRGLGAKRSEGRLIYGGGWDLPPDLGTGALRGGG